jgi:SnoaL-like domain
VTDPGPLSADDRLALRLLVDEYADAVDRKDRPALVGLFTPDGELRVQGEEGPAEGVYTGPGISSAIDVIDGFQRTFHHIGGALFRSDPTSPDGATGRVQCLAHHYDRTSNGPVDLVMFIRYLDEYARVGDSTWLIARRQVVIEWTELHPAHPARRARATG